MEVQLLKNTYNTNSFTRNFVENKSVSCVLKEGSDVMSPTILLEISNPTKYNMMYIPSFGGRYYFINWRNVNNDMWEAYATEIDALYTYKNQILALTAIVDKQETFENNYINDGSYVSEVRTSYETHSFPVGFNDDPQFILITAGA